MNVQFISILDDIFDKKNNIKLKFLDPCRYNLHLIFEQLIKYIVKKINNYGITENNLIDLQKSLKEYIKIKIIELKNYKKKNQ